MTGFDLWYVCNFRQKKSSGCGCTCLRVFGHARECNQQLSSSHLLVVYDRGCVLLDTNTRFPIRTPSFSVVEGPQRPSATSRFSKPRDLADLSTSSSVPRVYSPYVPLTYLNITPTPSALPGRHSAGLVVHTHPSLCAVELD